MKIQTRQRGFGLIEIILALGIISLALSAYIPWQAKQEQKKVGLDYAAYVSRVISGVQEYQYWKISENPNITAEQAFPNSLNNLMNNNGQWWPECNMSDYRNKKCIPPDVAPWYVGASIDYNVIPATSNPDHPAYAEIKIPLNLMPVKDRAYWKGPLIALPYAKEQPNGDIKIKIYDPMLSQFYKKAFDSFIKKDGSTPLTGDWDVGNKAITNASIITVRNQTGKQTIMGTGTVKEFTVPNGKKIPYSAWDCPIGLKKTIHLSINAKIPPPGEQYIGLAGEIPYYDDHYPSYFVVKMNYNAKLKSLGIWKEMHSGYISVRLNCSPIN